MAASLAGERDPEKIKKFILDRHRDRVHCNVEIRAPRTPSEMEGFEASVCKVAQYMWGVVELGEFSARFRGIHHGQYSTFFVSGPIPGAPPGDLIVMITYGNGGEGSEITIYNQGNTPVIPRDILPSTPLHRSKRAPKADTKIRFIT